MLIIAVTFTVHDAHREAFRRAVVDNARTSLAVEEGCLRFDVCQSEGGDVFFLYEQYVDDAAFDLHLKSQHFLEFNETSKSWVQDKRVDRYQLID